VRRKERDKNESEFGASAECRPLIVGVVIYRVECLCAVFRGPATGQDRRGFVVFNPWSTRCKGDRAHCFFSRRIRPETGAVRGGGGDDQALCRPLSRYPLSRYRAWADPRRAHQAWSGPSRFGRFPTRSGTFPFRSHWGRFCSDQTPFRLDSRSLRLGGLGIGFDEGSPGSIGRRLLVDHAELLPPSVGVHRRLPGPAARIDRVPTISQRLYLRRACLAHSRPHPE
jgi:hypothetical protein